ncbi:MAG: hypothetical protein M1833_001115 [Piccolia ochrophora]|nr:MAG: hypothetical protein M1833_001115 [Piccolia ochrophora]
MHPLPRVAFRRLPPLCRRPISQPLGRYYSTNDPVPASTPEPQKPVQNVSSTNTVPTSSTGVMDAALQEQTDEAEERRTMQAPDRKDIWSPSQAPRKKAMVGPRFEQTIMEYQPRPHAAISLIHKQPVRWTKNRVVACDGGGGPLGHPKIFINVDKPQINMCTYCGLPFIVDRHMSITENIYNRFPIPHIL